MVKQQAPPRGAGADQATIVGNRALREDLRRAGRGEVGVYEAFQTLTLSQEEHARAAANLLQHETWVVSLIIRASAPIWRQLPGPTLRFAPDQAGDSEPSHLKLGRFSHLGALAAPSIEEQALIAADTPCFARVFPHEEREAVGHIGVLACSYVPISMVDAVVALGFARIVAEIETATRKACHALLTAVEIQHDRQDELLRIERMLGWEPEPLADPNTSPAHIKTRLALMLTGQGDSRPLISGAAGVGVLAAIGGLLLGSPLLLVAVLIGIGLVIWKVT